VSAVSRFVFLEDLLCGGGRQQPGVLMLLGSWRSVELRV
jgi:hypothetical protein